MCVCLCVCLCVLCRFGLHTNLMEVCYSLVQLSLALNHILHGFSEEERERGEAEGDRGKSTCKYQNGPKTEIRHNTNSYLY